MSVARGAAVPTVVTVNAAPMWEGDMVATRTSARKRQGICAECSAPASRWSAETGVVYCEEHWQSLMSEVAAAEYPNAPPGTVGQSHTAHLLADEAAS